MKTYPHNSHKKVRTLALDNDGNVWAGTTDGILIMSLKNNVFSIKELQSSEEEPESILMSNDIVYIARGRQGDMWVGTNGGGLAHTIGKDSQGRWLFENFGAHDGLPSEEIVSITFDRRGNVWFATDHVICSFDTNKRIFSTFSSLDGVDETMCSEGAAIAMDNDIIIFGTINGYYVIDRNKLGGTVGSMLKLRITDFWLNDELQSPRRNKNYAYYVPDSRRVRLISHSDKIAFRFAALNYQLQHRVHYQYMLTGYDKTWRNATNSRIATYENLPTGHYRFEVKCFLLESPEKYDLRYIDVTVPPYFLFSRNAVWIYMLIGTILALWLMFRRQAQLARREQNRRLSEDNSQDAPASSEFIKQQQEWLDIHAANSNLTSDDMVQASGMTADEFTSLLRSATGLSPREYLNDYRMKKAVKLLIETNNSIAEVAYNTGFGDPTTFNRQFRIATGTSPSKYRDEHRQQQKPETDSYELIDE
jgi:AraC-like DNA-binding protein